MLNFRRKIEGPKRVQTDVKKMSETDAEVIVAIEFANDEAKRYGYHLTKKNGGEIDGEYHSGDSYELRDSQGNDTGVRFHPETSEEKRWGVAGTAWTYDPDDFEADKRGLAPYSTVYTYAKLSELLQRYTKSGFGPKGNKYEFNHGEN